eukprot:14252351-Alexandrium_andersonii.AAC.1
MSVRGGAQECAVVHKSAQRCMSCCIRVCGGAQECAVMDERCGHGRSGLATGRMHPVSNGHTSEGDIADNCSWNA